MHKPAFISDQSKLYACLINCDFHSLIELLRSLLYFQAVGHLIQIKHSMETSLNPKSFRQCHKKILGPISVIICLTIQSTEHGFSFLSLF